jgi:hypothetical protein
MASVHAASDVVHPSRALRALAIALVMLGVATETAGAPWELRIEIPGATFVAVRDVSSNRRFAVGSYCGPGSCSNFFWDRGHLTTISVPGVQETYLTGVNGQRDQRAGRSIAAFCAGWRRILQAVDFTSQRASISELIGARRPDA